MATRRKAAETKAEEVDLSKDQTRDEAEEDAAAQVAEHELKEAAPEIPDQTEGEAQLANVIAEEDEARAKSSTKKGYGTVQVLASGLSVEGKILIAGRTVEIPEAVANQSEDEQVKAYGQVFFRKA